jgi:predicted nucleic acid-binding protein
VADLLVDTDVFIDHLRGDRRLLAGRDRLSYSVVTRAELFAGRSANRDGLRQLLAAHLELPVDREVAELAGLVRRETGARLPDALIAATAIVHGFTLVTRNRRDFDRVPRLRVREPA